MSLRSSGHLACLLALALASLACASPKPELPAAAGPSLDAQDEDPALDTDDGGDDEGSGTLSPIEPSDDGSEGAAPDPDMGCDEAAAIGSHIGCELWALDLPRASASGPAPEEPRLAVAVVSGGDATALVEVFVGRDSVPIATVELGGGEAHTFDLPAMNVDAMAVTDGGLAYRIESDVPIAAYQWYAADASGAAGPSDASRLLPAHLLGSRYSAVTGDGLWSVATFGFLGAFVSVVAIEDGTTVELEPTWHNLVGGDPKTVILDRGEVFTALSQSDNPFPQLPLPQAELSGSRIVASKPVAVFSGNVATQEPISTCCADHLEEQLAPIEAWGTEYAVAPPPARGAAGHDRAAYRIVGLADGTELVYSPRAPEGAPTTIDAEQSVRFESDAPFTVASTDPGKPFSVTQFLLSRHAIDVESPSGDPAMIALPARDAFGPTHVVYAPEGFATSFATVVREVGTHATSADLVGMAEAQWSAVGSLGGIAYELATLPIDARPHSITCERPCSVISIGYGDGVGYGYVAGRMR